MAYIFKEKEMEPFEKTDLQSSGLNQNEILRMQIKMKKDRILGCVILYKDKIAYEYYKNPKVEHNLHAIHSSTKSFISALIGICIQQKLIDSIDMPITSFFGSAFERKILGSKL
jgi:CubicO group peptidase (beta-lactamase class C family)